MEASTLISKESLRGQAMWDRVKVPEKVICETVRVKLKLQWRPQDVRDVRKKEPLLKEATRREVMWIANSKVIGGGERRCPKPVLAHQVPRS
jgi:hypothetical protein